MLHPKRGGSTARNRTLKTDLRLVSPAVIVAASFSGGRLAELKRKKKEFNTLLDL